MRMWENLFVDQTMIEEKGWEHMVTVSYTRERMLSNWVLGNAPGLDRKETPSKCQPLDRQAA